MLSKKARAILDAIRPETFAKSAGNVPRLIVEHKSDLSARTRAFVESFLKPEVKAATPAKPPVPAFSSVPPASVAVRKALAAAMTPGSTRMHIMKIGGHADLKVGFEKLHKQREDRAASAAAALAFRKEYPTR
jgi:hypothetical protein